MDETPEHIRAMFTHDEWCRYAAAHYNQAGVLERAIKALLARIPSTGEQLEFDFGEADNAK